MLHAVYTVELFLQNLAIRKCNFHIVFFDDHAPIAAPATSSPATSHKYLLARQVLISHLQRNLNHRSKSLVRNYPSYHDNDFSLFLRESGVYFIMCHDGCDDKESPAELALQSMILWFITRSYNVVLLNGVDFIDTRVSE
jgi:ATP-dependent RNA helicase DDX60